MSNPATITAETRSTLGTGPARKLRRQGYIPAILYGRNQESVPLAISNVQVEAVISAGRATSTLYDLKYGTNKVSVLPKAFQFDPITDRPIHVDLYVVEKNLRITVSIRVNFINQDISPGLKAGGVLNVVRHEVEIECPASAIPEELIADVGANEIGDSIHYSALTVPAGVEPAVKGRDFTVATIAAPTLEVESQVVEQVEETPEEEED